MAKVRVKVRLTNWDEECLARAGHPISGEVHSCEIEGLVDTRSPRCVIPRHLLDRMGLETNIMRFEILGRSAVQDALVSGNDLILGYTLLALLDLVVDCDRWQVIPNPKHPNGPVFRV